MQPGPIESFWTASSILDALLGIAGGRSPVAGSNWQAPQALIDSGQVICTDSRTIQAGQIFIAIPGEKVDGHTFIASVLQSSPGLIISQKNASQLNLSPADATRFDQIAIIVPSTLSALQALARAYRRFLGHRGCKFIAVCGSNGKTTTVRMLHAMAASTMQVTASQKSFNNHLGVPLTILSAKPLDQLVICEAGTNHPGELELLGHIIQPDTLLYTSIGREHLEGFGSLDGVMREEASIARFVGLFSGIGSIISSVQIPAFTTLLEAELDNRLISSGGHITINHLRPNDLTDVHHIVMPSDHPDSQLRIGLCFTDRHGNRWQVPIPGAHNAANAALAAHACQVLDQPFDDGTTRRQAALATAKLGDMRLMVQQIGTIHILNDAYNANPESTLSSLQTFADLRQGIWRNRRGVLILGEMRELGTNTIAMHAEVLQSAINLRSPSNHPDDQLILMGDLFAQAAATLSPLDLTYLHIIPDLNDTAMQQAASLIKPGDCLLLKASRGVRLERITDYLRAAITQPTQPLAERKR
jgi:UDP-N-acetylmuramoyl-tripeptide--D-alanyl-D-alanine ligase